MDDPDFRKSVVISVNDNFDDSDDVGMEEYTRDDDQFSNYDINSDNVGKEEYTRDSDQYNINDYSQVVVKSHDMKHGNY